MAQPSVSTVACCDTYSFGLLVEIHSSAETEIKPKRRFLAEIGRNRNRNRNFGWTLLFIM